MSRCRIAGKAIDALRQDYPFFRPVLIQPGTYPNHSAPIHTIGVESLPVCRADLDKTLVHDLTRALFETQRRWSTSSQQPHWIDARLAAATPIPLHPGAALYYRELELVPDIKD